MKNEMGGARSTYRRGSYRILVGKPEGRRPLGRPRRRWKYNIETDLEVGLGINLIYLARYKVRRRAILNAVMSLRIT
jgi:hypothetical protein